MKIVLGKRGKLWLLVGIPIIVCLAISIYSVFSNGDLQARYDKVQMGMTWVEVDKILWQTGYPEPPGHSTGIRYKAPESWWVPGGVIHVLLDDQNRVIHKRVYHPGAHDILRRLRERWTHWLWLLGIYDIDSTPDRPLDDLSRRLPFLAN